MNLKEIRDIIDLMNEHGLMELEIEREGAKIKIKKTSSDGKGPTLPLPPEYQIESSPTVPERISPMEERPTHHQEIKSPMVGTFYLAPSPESPPFVQIGDVLEVGQVVCIIEAMKLMNEIKSEVKGKIVEVLIDNAQPVEFGQILFVVEPL